MGDKSNSGLCKDCRWEDYSDNCFERSRRLPGARCFEPKPQAAWCHSVVESSRERARIRREMAFEFAREMVSDGRPTHVIPEAAVGLADALLSRLARKDG